MAILSDIAIWTKPLARRTLARVRRAALLRASGFLLRGRQCTDNIGTVLNTWVQGKLAFWRGLGDEMAKRPLKTHTHWCPN
jgi:hypothetical protein